MAGFSSHKVFAIYLRESLDDGSDFTNPDADYRMVFLGEDGTLKTKDSAGSVATVGGGAGSLDLSALTLERRIQGVTDYVAGYDGSAADERGFPVGMLRMSRQHTIIADECFFRGTSTTLGIYDGGINENNSGTAAAISHVAGSASHPGVVALSTGTTTTGRSALITGNSGSAVAAGSGKMRFGAVARTPTLSDGTNTYTVRLGIGAFNAGDGAEGICFRYGSALNGGEWQGVCRTGGSESGSVLDTNVAGDTNFHTFEFEVNAGGTSVEFFIDGASVGTVTTNIPTGALTLAPASILKSAGGTARTLEVDAYWYHFEFATAR